MTIQRPLIPLLVALCAAPALAEARDRAPESAAGLYSFTLGNSGPKASLGWNERLEPARSSHLRRPADGRVFERRADPEVSVNFDESAVHLHGRGLRFSRGRETPWSLGLNYRRVDLGQKSELRIDEITERPKMLEVEWRMRFD